MIFKSDILSDLKMWSTVPKYIMINMSHCNSVICLSVFGKLSGGVCRSIVFSSVQRSRKPEGTTLHWTLTQFSVYE